MNPVDPYAAVVGRSLGGGRYVVQERMDEGGMGAVFRATDEERGDAVAIKVLHPDLARETRHIARFYREAEAAMALRHPHIVETRTVGGADDELCWFAMELLEGRSLHQIQESGKTVFSPDEVIRIGRQILSALEATHSIGVLHRDLKPGNVMLVAGPEGQVAKLVDFGIAVFTSSETYTRLTATGMVLGTPAYMPPEQVCGDDLDVRTDVYSLAATLHTILVGEPPYGRGTWGDILPKILTGLRTPLEQRGVDRPLASVIEQGLAVDREARWGSAREMELALTALDASGTRTVLEWQPPPEIASMHLAPFDNTGPGFRSTMHSDRPGPFPSTREQPSSNPPPKAETREQPSSDPPPMRPAAGAAQPASRLQQPDGVIRARPESDIRLPTRSAMWPMIALGMLGSAVAAGAVFVLLSDSADSEAQPSTTSPAMAPAEATSGDEEASAESTPAIPVGVEAPVIADEGEGEEAPEEETAEADRRRASRRRRARIAAQESASGGGFADDDWKEEEEVSSPPADMDAPAPQTAAASASSAEMDGPPSIMVNVVSGGAMSVTTVAPGGDPSVVETPGTHGPMVTYRTHRR